MPNNIIPVSALRKWCRFKASTRRSKRDLVAKLSRPAKIGVQHSLLGLPGTPKHGRRYWGNVGKAAKTGVRFGRLMRKIASGENLDLERQRIEFRPGILDGLPTLGIPHEVPAERRFEIGGRDFVLRGRIDAESSDGTGWEYKTFSDWQQKIQRIDRSYQWRSYLWLKPELTAVNYCLFRIKYENGRPLVTERLFAPVKSRYDGLERDMREVLEDFVAWVDIHCPTYWD